MEQAELVTELNKERLDLCSTANISKRPLIKAGAVPHSEEGIFNPSVCATGNEATLIFRAEPTNNTWKGHFLEEKAVPMIATGFVNNDSISLHSEPHPIESGMPMACRPEDWRIFRHRQKTYVNFTNYFYFNNGWPQKIARSRTALGTLEEGRISYIREMDASDHLEMGREEKNWCFFSEEDELFCVYSIEPFVVLHCDALGKVLNKKETFKGLPRRNHKFVANSTNPILVNLDGYGEVYLMFVHQFCTPLGKSRNRVYYQHALLFSKYGHEPVAFTPKPITGGGSAEGRHDGVVYFSGALETEDNILVTAGEGDSHSSCYCIPKTDLIKNLQAI